MNTEFNYNNTANLGEIKKTLWTTLDLLRGVLDSEQYIVILYLISLFNEGAYPKITFEKSEKAVINIPDYDLESIRIHPSSERLNKLYSFHDHFQPYLKLIPVKILNQIGVVLNSCDKKIFKEYFSEIFDFLLFEISRSKGKKGGEYLQPVELTEFVFKLANPPEYAQVYNPFAGYASFGVQLNTKSLYLAEEINYSIWVIGSLRLMANNREFKTKYQNDTSLNEDSFFKMIQAVNPKVSLSEYGHDLIVSNPPMGMFLSETFEGKFGKIKTAEHFLIEKGIEELKPNGKLIAVLGLSFASRSGVEKELRKFLVENDLIELIIELPAGLQSQTIATTFIIVINKNKKDQGYVNFVDGKSFLKETIKVNKILDVDNLMRCIDGNTSTKFFKKVSKDSISFMDYNLDPHRYFMKDYYGYELGELMSSISGERKTDFQGKFVQIKNLSNDKFLYHLELDSIPNSDTSMNYLEISESCLLIAAVGENLNPTFFKYNGTSIFINQNIFAFKVNLVEVDLDYLIAELYSDLTIEQLNIYQTATVQRKINKKDFLSIRIPVPGIIEQIAKVKGQKQEYLKSKEKELFLESEILELKEETFREFASMKHTFRQFLNAIKSNVSGTHKYLLNNANANINLNSIYSENLNRTLGEHLSSVVDNVNSLSHLLTSFEEKNVSASNQEVDLAYLIKEAQNRFKNESVFKFEPLFIDLASFENGPDSYSAPIVNIHPEDFFRLFSNIIDNAVKHGFKERENNLIRTTLSFDRKKLSCILEISNNGTPMADNFTLKHLTTRGEKTSDSSGTGVGGADIKGILDKYNGSISLRQERESDFPITYVIALPLIITIL